MWCCSWLVRGRCVEYVRRERRAVVDDVHGLAGQHHECCLDFQVVGGAVVVEPRFLEGDASEQPADADRVGVVDAGVEVDVSVAGLDLVVPGVQLDLGDDLDARRCEVGDRIQQVNRCVSTRGVPTVVEA